MAARLRRGLRPITGWALVSALVVAGCGTRVERVGPANTVATGGTVGSGSVSGPAERTTGDMTTSPPSGPVSARPGPAVGAAGSRASAAPAAPEAGTIQSAERRPAVPASSGFSEPARSGTSSPPVPRGPGTAPMQPSGGRSPAVIASVSTTSGPIGSVVLPGIQAVQTWVRYVNARGGVNGHPVKLLVYDDGADPARHQAHKRQAIEKDKVIAFVHNAEGAAGQQSVPYINEKRVPVIGGDAGEEYYYQSPMYFPQASFARTLYATGVYSTAAQAKALGKRKLAVLACVEVKPCTESDEVFAELAPGEGLDQVYRGKGSLTQPDFTAECLAVRNAGAEIFVVILDPNSITRVAASCARQGYRPIYASLVSLILDRFKDDPNLDGMLAASNVFPYFQTGTPATDEFQAAIRQYGQGIIPGVSLAGGWVSAKLFERAAAALPEPPTSDSVLRGLWAIQNDNLGGLTSPLTFRENQPALRVACWYDMAIQNKAWSSPGMKLHCR